MDILCIGMYRACSTWQYNVACALVERHGGGSRLGFIHGHQYEPQTAEGPRTYRVLKSHDGHERFAEALRDGHARAIYSERDLRDVAFSLMHKWCTGFEEVMAPGGLIESCLASSRFWTRQPNVLYQRYDALIADPVESVREIAAHIGVALDADEADVVAGEYSLGKNLGRMEKLADRLRASGVNLDAPENALRFDPETLLHWNHMRTGRARSWREQATPEQRAALAELCGEWLIDRGYEEDTSWVDEVSLTSA